MKMKLQSLNVLFPFDLYFIHILFVSNLDFICFGPTNVTESIVSPILLMLHASVNAEKIASMCSFLLSTETKL